MIGSAVSEPVLPLTAPVGELLDVFLVDARGALEQTRMQVEHVTGIGFATRRAAQQQRNLTISHGLLGQIVVHDQRVFTAVAEVLAHGAARIRRDVLHCRRFRCGGGNDDGVCHGAVLFQLAHHVGHRAGLLADRDVDALNAGTLLVDDGVDGQRGLAGLAVADDQLALAAADRDHRVDCLVTGLHRLRHRLAPDHARRDLFHRRAGFGGDRALAVDGLAQRVHHATEQLRTDRHFQNAPGGLGGVAFTQVLVCTQHHGADRVAFQIERQCEGVVRQFDHFASHHVRQPVHAHDAVGDAGQRAFVARYQ